ncbi:F-box/WD repeat-containing protein 7 [Lingula anatina]|uniref:F-box/WD repeat-containing protein 7 n=1 Tax=Lingula anatina TaxID=7574 RepID=A0A1S3GZ05_LINAN|nr:F-box/WD repeat-containing protein 7 [Lingula anatina]XP_013378994.1 F-box/WD repeat-containing protein 7 [Lingula anatina]|eukprot:XP_013378993.1 F-box/WD repeat-containing protein 7 [Lingula anatina]
MATSRGKRLDINSASVDDLAGLVGIGRTKAEAIFDYRKKFGAFASVSDLRRVPGIGPGALEENLGKLTCNKTRRQKKFESSSRELRGRRCMAEKSRAEQPGSSCNPQHDEVSPSASGGEVENEQITCTCQDSNPTQDVDCGIKNPGSTRGVVVETFACRCSRASENQPSHSSEACGCGNSELKCQSRHSSQSADSQCADCVREDHCSDCAREDASSPCTHANSNGEASGGLASPSNTRNDQQSQSNHCDSVSEKGDEDEDRDEEDEDEDLQLEEEEEDLGVFSDRENSLEDQPVLCNSNDNTNGLSTAYQQLNIASSVAEGAFPSLHDDTEEEEDPIDTCSRQEEEEEEGGEEEDEEERDMYLGDRNTEMRDSEDEYEDQFESVSPFTLRSRFPGSLDKNLMKRKSEISSDVRGVSPGKRLKAGESSSALSNVCHNFGTIKTSANAQPIRRIPSRSHPPEGLADWLDTFLGWSNAERLLALDELIELCEPTQVRHMMAVIEPQFQRDFISLLPKELALYVLSFLDPKDLLRAAQTCRYWRVLAEDNLLWREKCREENIDETTVFENHIRRRSSSSFQKSPWKSLYMRQHRIEQNWRTGNIRDPKLLKGHDDHVITCLEFCGTRIVSGSDDNTLKVWSAITGKCLRTLVGHTGGVWSSQMHGNIIISGSTDRTLKVWNADTGQCIHTLYGHTSTVRCMHLHGSKVVSGSRDATLRVWDIDSGQCLHVLMGHVAAVRCVQYDGRRVVSGAYDYTVKVWDPETETCLHTLTGHTNRVYSLQFDGVHIVSGSLDTSICVWDVESGNCLHTLIGHQSLTSGMELKDNILVSGNADSTVKIWDITTGQCLQTLQGPNKHQSAVTCLQFNKKFVITSSDDGTVKLWDLRTGDFLRNLVALDSGGSGGVVWRVRCSNTKLVCAVGSRNGTEETKLLVLDFDVEEK